MRFVFDVRKDDASFVFAGPEWACRLVVKLLHHFDKGIYDHGTYNQVKGGI